MPSILNRLQSGWNAFLGRDPTSFYRYEDIGMGSSYRPDRSRFYKVNDQSIVSVLICRIGIDAATVDIKHVMTEDNRYSYTMKSSLNNALTVEANIDQTGRAFIQDVVMSMCDEGVVAIVPTDTTANPFKGTYEIDKLRVGKIVEWYPNHVRVELYNEQTGLRELLVLPKAMVAIVENPFYSIMNEPNSTLQRLKRTLNTLDVLDDRNASGKLDMIIQLPYTTRTQSRKDMAEARRKEVEMQLVGSKYGIAYTDVQEKIVQLNRPIENNYWAQAKELTSMLYSQLGITEAVLDGTADETAMTNYYNRTIEPILAAITEEMERKFLTKTARTQGQAIKYFRDPLKLVSATSIAELADKLTRNEIASSNEIRMAIGWSPSKDPKADELRNSNISQSSEGQPEMPMGLVSEEDSKEGGQSSQPEPETETGEDEEVKTNDDLSDEEIDELIEELSSELGKLQDIKNTRSQNS